MTELEQISDRKFTINFDLQRLALGVFFTFALFGMLASSASAADYDSLKEQVVPSVLYQAKNKGWPLNGDKTKRALVDNFSREVLMPDVAKTEPHLLYACAKSIVYRDTVGKFPVSDVYNTDKSRLFDYSRRYSTQKKFPIPADATVKVQRKKEKSRMKRMVKYGWKNKYFPTWRNATNTNNVDGVSKVSYSWETDLDLIKNVRLKCDAILEKSLKKNQKYITQFIAEIKSVARVEVSYQ